MKRNLLKTLFLTAAFAMGANSLWAEEGDVTTNIDIDFSNAISDDNTIEGTVGTMTTVDDSSIDDYGRLTLAAGTHSVVLSEDEYAGATDVVEVSFEMAAAALNTAYTGFYLYDADGSSIAYFNVGPYNTTIDTNLGLSYKDFYKYGSSSTWMSTADDDDWSTYATKITITIDYSEGTVTTTCSGYSSNSYETTLASSNPVASIAFVASGTYYGYMSSGAYSFSSYWSKIDNVKMTTTEGAAAETADYTIKKIDEEGNTLAEVTLSGIVGNSIALADTYTADFYNDDETVKYVYVSDDASEQTIASDGSTVVTITFREADSYSYTIYASVDGSVIQSGSVFEDESVTVYYPKYLCIDGTLYSASSQNSGYYYTLTITADGQSQTISYSATDITDVVFFTEGEDIDGITVVSSGNTAIRSSCGKAGYAEEDLTITTLSPGTYTISAAAYASTSTVFTFTIGDEEVYSCTGYNYFYEFSASDEITLTESADLVIASGSGNANYGLDFIYVQGTVDDTTTGISEAAIESASSDGTIYSLQGIKVSNPSKGLYIQNGKKVIIK